jgi:hypothetical protein
LRAGIRLVAEPASRFTDCLKLKLMAKRKKDIVRKVLVILSNRFNRLQQPKYLELEAKADGSILRQRSLRGTPRKPIYDEVWENDDAKTSLDSCTRMRHRYNHPLQRKAA